MNEARSLLDQLIRRQRSKLTARLVNRFGYHHLTLIEDAIQDAILKALEKWEYEGLPDEAGAWLYRVSHNRAIDMMRKVAPEMTYAVELDERSSDQTEEVAELLMLLHCCHPALQVIEQQLLMLNLVFGLDHNEIANLALVSKDSVSQRLSRAKRKTRADPHSALTLELLGWNTEATDAVVTAIYTAFSVGYFPRQGSELIRRDIAFEALRLGLSLAEQCRKEPEQQGRLYALCALMCFQCSRFHARTSELGEALMLEQQNRELWDQRLIEQGQALLSSAKQSSRLSDFHIEAAIAALHTEPNQTDWNTITQLHGALVEIKPTPGRIIAAAVATAKSGDAAAALALLHQLEQDSMSSYAPYHLAKAEILEKLDRPAEAELHLRNARASSKSAPIAALIEKRVI